jgi:Flp pilus assembly protein TadG
MPILANTDAAQRRPHLRRILNAAGGRLRAFGKDERAAAAVEFSLVSVPFLGIVLGALQLSLFFFASQILQSATTDAGRQLMTGQAQTAGMSAAQFDQLVCAPISGIFDCSKLMVDVESAGSFAAVNTAAPKITYDANGKVTNAWSWSPGAANQIVIVKVMYNWPVFGPAGLGLANQPDGSHLLVAVTVFKNEPFPT